MDVDFLDVCLVLYFVVYTKLSKNTFLFILYIL